MNAVAQKQKKIEVARAYLNKSLTYTKRGVDIVVLANTEIVVYVEEQIALIGADHVFIRSEQYTLV